LLELGLRDVGELLPIRGLVVTNAALLECGRVFEALIPMERGSGPGREKKDVSVETSFRELLEDFGVLPKAALESQRVACLLNCPVAEQFSFLGRPSLAQGTAARTPWPFDQR
jgi:hypothetical protein